MIKSQADLFKEILNDYEKLKRDDASRSEVTEEELLENDGRAVNTRKYVKSSFLWRYLAEREEEEAKRLISLGVGAPVTGRHSNYCRFLVLKHWRETLGDNKFTEEVECIAGAELKKLTARKLSELSPERKEKLLGSLEKILFNKVLINTVRNYQKKQVLEADIYSDSVHLLRRYELYKQDEAFERIFRGNPAESSVSYSESSSEINEDNNTGVNAGINTGNTPTKNAGNDISKKAGNDLSKQAGNDLSKQAGNNLSKKAGNIPDNILRNNPEYNSVYYSEENVFSGAKVQRRDSEYRKELQSFFDWIKDVSLPDMLVPLWIDSFTGIGAYIVGTAYLDEDELMESEDNRLALLIPSEYEMTAVDDSNPLSRYDLRMIDVRNKLDVYPPDTTIEELYEDFCGEIVKEYFYDDVFCEVNNESLAGLSEDLKPHVPEELRRYFRFNEDDIITITSETNSEMKGLQDEEEKKRKVAEAMKAKKVRMKNDARLRKRFS